MLFKRRPSGRLFFVPSAGSWLARSGNLRERANTKSSGPFRARQGSVCAVHPVAAHELPTLPPNEWTCYSPPIQQKAALGRLSCQSVLLSETRDRASGEFPIVREPLTQNCWAPLAISPSCPLRPGSWPSCHQVQRVSEAWSVSRTTLHLLGCSNRPEGEPYLF